MARVLAACACLLLLPTAALGLGTRASSTAGDSGSLPAAIALGPGGTVFIADSLSDTINELSSAGVETTLAGNGTNGYSGDGGPATSAELSLGDPGVAVDAGGDVLISDDGNSVVRMVAGSSCSSGCPFGLASTTKGDIYTIAGDGTYGAAGDGGPATSAEVGPQAIAVDPAGDALFLNGVQAIRLVAASSCSRSCPYGLASMTAGDIYTIAGGATQGYSGDGGPATSAKLDSLASSMAVDAHGNLLIPDTDNKVVRLVAGSSCSSACPYGLASMTIGDIYTIVGTDADLSTPQGVAVDTGGDVLIADGLANEIYAVAGSSCPSGCLFGIGSTTKGDVYTVAGDGSPGPSGDDGPAAGAELNGPQAVAVDAGGDLLIADSFNGEVRLVAASSCASRCPYGLASTTKGDIYTIASSAGGLGTGTGTGSGSGNGSGGNGGTGTSGTSGGKNGSGSGGSGGSGGSSPHRGSIHSFGPPRVKGEAVEIPVMCSDGTAPCQFVVRLAHDRVDVGRARVRVGAGVRERVRVPLNRTGLRLLRNRRSLRVGVKAGQASTPLRSWNVTFHR